MRHKCTAMILGEWMCWDCTRRAERRKPAVWFFRCSLCSPHSSGIS